MTTPEFSIRTANADEYERAARIFTSAMLFEFTPSEVGRARFEPERALIAEIDGEAAGVTKAMTRDLSIPGGVVPAAHISGVGVGQTFRRRGVLSGLMRRQLREVPEALAVLWASETAIYGRYGYAVASAELRLAAQLPQLGVKPVNDSGRLRAIEADTAATVLPPVLAEYQKQRPGVSGRRPVEWATTLDDPAEFRHGASARRITVHEDASGKVDGYALWRTKLEFDEAGVNGEVTVEEVVATTPEAYGALWSNLLTMDLCRKLNYMHAAVDEPVQQLVSNTRALSARWSDALWVRVTDVRRALEQRRFGAPIDLVLNITDDLIASNSGHFHLRGDIDKAHCEPTDAPADISLSVNELGSAYLGGRSLAEFAVTGKVTEHTPGAVHAASAGFGWPVAPGSIEIF
ncbi:GNAT family N-acetyltransferase [Stackebrandtia nassauensis]|uniref:Acetyltransferase n=1 Tax=Stackebrandtia nassauensis (strain DSM 44728 / CIP 108903 / NRRL B-16338 / NBRC 102104 / LLR-40K-21) TaxID=446470 RepID=D3Q4P4_STANL|nr:GNAT family N-acetyltransferase [Stackebrandtia nassauensis]ADD42074.1 acetyltransferase [Stackebrandtia nassauensis DSM 44728]